MSLNPSLEEIEDFLDAAGAGHADIVEPIVLAYGSAVFAWRDQYGFTAMQSLAIDDHVDDEKRLSLLAFMLEHGASANEKLTNDYPIFTVQGRSKAYYELLIRHGADCEGESPDGKSPLMRAASQDNVRLLDALLEKGVNINKRDMRGLTALMHAARTASCRAAKILVKHGADIHVRDADGGNALFHAAIMDSGHGREAEIALLLLESGIDPYVTNARGETAVIAADKRGDRFVYEEMRDYIAHKEKTATQSQLDGARKLHPKFAVKKRNERLK